MRIRNDIVPLPVLLFPHHLSDAVELRIEYVIRHDGDLPKPEIKWMFPTNYEDYHYTEGIAKEIESYYS